MRIKATCKLKNIVNNKEIPEIIKRCGRKCEKRSKKGKKLVAWGAVLKHNKITLAARRILFTRALFFFSIVLPSKTNYEADFFKITFKLRNELLQKMKGFKSFRVAL